EKKGAGLHVVGPGSVFIQICTSHTIAQRRVGRIVDPSCPTQLVVLPPWDGSPIRPTPKRRLSVRSHLQRKDMRAIQDYYVASSAVITGNVVLSAGANVWYGTVIRGDLAPIMLGPRVNLQDGCIVHTDYDLPQDIEEGVVVGHGAILHGRRIGRHSLVGI